MQPSSSFKYHEPHDLLSQSLLQERQIHNQVNFQTPSPNTHTKDEETPLQQEHSHLNTPQNRFYQQYKKIYTVSYHLYMQKLRQIELFQKINNQIKQIEDRFKSCKEKVVKKGQSEENRTKRSRRTAQMIQKKYRCSVIYCQRLYGTQGSLQQHIKLKHPQIYSKEYEIGDMNNQEMSYESSSI